MPNYTLYYFDGKGRAELIRTLFAVAGVEYKDVRVEREKWAELKPNSPFGQMPYMEIDGAKFCQSNALARYFARKFKVAGKNETEELQADMIVDCLEDTMKPIPAFHFEADETRKATLKKKYLEETLPTSLKHLEAFLVANQGGDKYFVGNDLTWADIAFLSAYNFMTLGGGADQLAKYPKLNALKDRVEKIPKIAEWIAKRPKTEF